MLSAVVPFPFLENTAAAFIQNEWTMRADTRNTESLSESSLDNLGKIQDISTLKKQIKSLDPPSTSLLIFSKNSCNFQQEVDEMEPGVQIVHS